MASIISERFVRPGKDLEATEVRYDPIDSDAESLGNDAELLQIKREIEFSMLRHSLESFSETVAAGDPHSDANVVGVGLGSA